MVGLAGKLQRDPENMSRTLWRQKQEKNTTWGAVTKLILAKMLKYLKKSLPNADWESIREQEFVIESISDSKDKEYEAFSLDVSLVVVDLEKEY